MSIVVPLYGFGGGAGGALNFTVKAYATEAVLLSDAPKENTIGVITETEVTSWIFSASEPSDPAEGMVWIVTGTSSAAEFNGAKKNTLMVYPLSAKQYAGDAWAAVTAKSYQAGAWHDWMITLFPNGEIYWYGTTSGNGSASVGDVITLTEQWISLDQVQQVKTGSPHDVTSYRKLCMRISSNNNNTSKRIGISNAGNTDIRDGNLIAMASTNGAGIVELDISGFTGSYYIYVGQHTSSGASNNSAEIDKVWME